jgi:hypothetical protein
MLKTEKYNKIEQEYESFKAKLIKEYKYIKNEFDKSSKERDILRDTLFEFKKYFMRFHLSEDGDILYVDEM